MADSMIVKWIQSGDYTCADCNTGPFKSTISTTPTLKYSEFEPLASHGFFENEHRLKDSAEQRVVWIDKVAEESTHST